VQVHRGEYLLAGTPCTTWLPNTVALPGREEATVSRPAGARSADVATVEAQQVGRGERQRGQA
jgi:hypothetical protein